MRAESAYDSRAVSSAGAVGLMQIMPGTWRELRARHGLGSDPFDPRDNILAGAAYLREMHDRYGNITAMLAAYNAGPQRYDDYFANARELPAETRAYVSTIAPLLGAAPLPPAPSAAAVKSPTWRSAPLFVGGSNSASPTAEMRSGRRHDDSANAPQAPAGNPLSMPSPGLFVPRDSGGTSQ